MKRRIHWLQWCCDFCLVETEPLPFTHWEASSLPPGWSRRSREEFFVNVEYVACESPACQAQLAELAEVRS